MPENEIDKLFSDLPSEDKKLADVFNEAPKETPTPTPAKDEDEGDVRKNRRHRRLEEQYQKERESNIALNARIQALMESRETPVTKSSSDAPAEWIALYGDTPEAAKAWKMQESLMERYKQQAKEEAVNELQEREVEQKAEERKFEAFIDSQLETIEDKYDIDLTSDAPKARKTRRDFLEMVQNLSPKNDDGTITGYADFEQTFEIYKSRKETPVDNSARKEIAAISMHKSGAQIDGGQKPTPGFRGWEKDYNIR
jgi:hypothetical protein